MQSNLPVSKGNEGDSSFSLSRTTTNLSDVESGYGVLAAKLSSKPRPDATKEIIHEDRSLMDTETVTFDDGPIPDGGYSWVIVVCQFISQMATWGMACSYGVFISWFLGQNTFPGATAVDFGWIGGLCGVIVFGMSPVSNYISKLLPLGVTLAIAQTIIALALVFSGFATQIWHLALTMGLMSGVGLGLNFMATLPLISQWFLRRRALAMGIGSAGVGAGGLVFSLTSRLALEAYGVRPAYIINGVIVFVMLTPATFFFKSRMHVSNPKFRAVRWPLLQNRGLVYICIWSFFVMWGHLTPLLSIALYATKGLGLSQAQGASVQAILAAGQLLGRPCLGLILDRFGRINMASLVTFLSGMTCLCIWMFAKTYGVLLLFGASSGALSGIFFSALGPVLSEIVPLSDFSDSLSIVWLTCAPINLVFLPITFALNSYSISALGRTGTEAFLISIGVAGGANIVAALALFMAKRYKRKEQDV